MTPLRLYDREQSGGRTEWIAAFRGYFLSHHDDGDELWISHRPYGTNERIHKFPAGHQPSLEDIEALLGET